MKKLLILPVLILGVMLDPFPSASKREIQNILEHSTKIEPVGLARHGLTLTSSAGEYRLLLCYECNQMELFFPDGKHSSLVPLGGSSAETLNTLLNNNPGVGKSE